jgi:hypothetical protein
MGQGKPAARLQGYLDAFHAAHGPRDQDQQQLATRRDAALAGILSAAERRSLATEGAAWSDRRAAEEAAALQPR